jgi:hypothetical protein
VAPRGWTGPAELLISAIFGHVSWEAPRHRRQSGHA